MKTILLSIAFTLSVFGAEPAKEPPKPVVPPPPIVLSEADRLKFENLAYRQEIARRDQTELIRTVCEAAKVPVSECLIDPGKGVITRTPKVP